MTSAPEENQFVPDVARDALPAVPAAQDAAGKVRASDAERDAVAAVLSEALAQGRLTSAELAERIDAAHAAKTRAEPGRAAGWPAATPRRTPPSAR